MADEVVVIHPRDGVTADEIAAWLSENFQRAGEHRDDGPGTGRRMLIEGGNPLVNAAITTLPEPSGCPYCDAFAYSLQEEVEHMETVHPEVVAERRRAIGELRDKVFPGADRPETGGDDTERHLQYVAQCLGRTANLEPWQTLPLTRGEGYWLRQACLGLMRAAGELAKPGPSDG